VRTVCYRNKRVQNYATYFAKFVANRGEVGRRDVLRAAPECGLMHVFLIYFFFIFSDFCRPIISTSTGPIFTKFESLVELFVLMNDLKLLFRFLN